MHASDCAFYVSAKTLNFGLLLKVNVGPSEYFLTCFLREFHKCEGIHISTNTYPQTQKHKHTSTTHKHSTQAQKHKQSTQAQTHKHSTATQMCTLLVLARTVHRLGRGRSVRQPLCSRIIIHPCLHLSLSLPFSHHQHHILPTKAENSKCKKRLTDLQATEQNCVNVPLPSALMLYSVLQICHHHKNGCHSG